MRANALSEWDRPGGYLVRHAERVEPSSESVDYHIPLTAQGQRRAEDVGATIGHRLRALVTSAVPRCLETAEAIRNGSGLPVPIETDWRLGDPGVWVIDTGKAGDAFGALGPREVVRRQLAREELAGLRDLESGVRLLLDCILSRSPGDAGVAVFVSHDAVIAPLLGHLLMGADVDSIWPDFLEGVLLTRTENGIDLLWRGQRHTSVQGGEWRAK